MVADNEQIEFAGAKRGSVRRVAGQGECLEQEWSGLQTGARVKRPVYARFACDVDSVRRCLLSCRLVAARAKSGSCRLANRRNRVRERSDPADVVPIRVGGEYVSDLDTKLAYSRSNSSNLRPRDGWIDQYRLVTVGQEKRRGLP